MRIGVEANTYYKNLAGSGVYARNIINIWRKEGKEILLFASRRQSNMDLAKKKNIFIRLLNGIKDILWMQIILPIKLKKNKVDVFFCPAFISPIFSTCPVVVTLLDMCFLRYAWTCDKLYNSYLKLLLHFTKKRICMIVTISDFSKKEINELLKVHQEKIKVIYLGCGKEFRIINELEKIKNVKNKYGINQRFILNVGTLEPRKNITTLILAFDTLKKKKLIEHKLVLCGGKGWYYDDIFRKIEDLRLNKEVIFTGYVPENDLPFLYNAADVFVYPSLYEGFGLPVLEAMSCGCPVVTSNVSSIPEVVGNAGILVNPSSFEELAQAILKVVKDRELREDLVKKGLKRAKIFSWEKAAKETFIVLERVFNNCIQSTPQI